MTVEIRPLRGPLDEQQLDWLTALYGPVDAKYCSRDYVRHQFVGNPFGWAAHVFAVANGRAIGHCGVIPFHARRGTESFVAGKLEALAVDPAHRGRRAEDGGSVATDILSTLYPFAVECGTEVLFGLAPPAVARIHLRAGCHQVPTDAPAYTAVTDAASFGQNERSRGRRLAARAVARAQAVALGAASLAARDGARVEAPAPDDAELARASADGRWTVSGADAWPWFAGSGVLRALELPGCDGCRALVRLDDSQPAAVQIVSWQPRRRGVGAAFRLLSAAAALARERRAPTLRFQPWPGDGDGDGALAHACRLAGLLRRPEADLLLYPNDPRHDAVQLTPFFYVTF